MGRGSSKAGGSGIATSGAMGEIQKTIKSGDFDKAADKINDSIENAGYFMLEDGKDVLIFGKNYNDNFSDIAPGARGMDSVDMAKKINDLNGKWSAHKYDGQVEFPASLVSKKAGSGFLNAISLEKKPTNVKLKKVTTTPDGKNDIFEIEGTTKDKMFHYVAIRK